VRFLLRWLCRFAAVGLLGLLLAAPRLAPAAPSDKVGDRVLWLFANDSTLQQVSIASAVGLLLTAQLFFRQKRKPLPPLPKHEEPPPDEPVPPPPPRRE